MYSNQNHITFLNKYPKNQENTDDIVQSLKGITI